MGGRLSGYLEPTVNENSGPDGPNWKLSIWDGIGLERSSNWLGPDQTGGPC